MRFDLYIGNSKFLPVSNIEYTFNILARKIYDYFYFLSNNFSIENIYTVITLERDTFQKKIKQIFVQFKQFSIAKYYNSIILYPAI